jgi:hypothetical protein
MLFKNGFHLVAKFKSMREQRCFSQGGIMNIKTYTCAILFIGLILSFVMSPYLVAQEDQEKKQAEAVYIPKEVKEVFEAGMDNREPRLDIPFTVFKNIYLPARQNMHVVFFFKVKNSDLGFTPLTPAGGTPEKTEQEAAETPADTEVQLQSNAHCFLQFNQLDGNFVKEIYIPVQLQADGSTYDPEEEKIYTTGYPLPSGKYLLSMAITSFDLEKIGTQYVEFTLPDPASFTDTLETTPVFFVKQLNRMSSAEMKAEIHEGYFTYAVLQITPNLEGVFHPGDNLDIFFFIFGAQPNETNQFDIDATYSVMKGDEAIIKFVGTKYDAPIISQPLPLKKTVVIQTQEGDQVSEKKEQKDLEPGTYTLKIELKCNVSGKTLAKSVDFTVETE